jgi:hypothetical protein
MIVQPLIGHPNREPDSLIRLRMGMAVGGRVVGEHAAQLTRFPPVGGGMGHKLG